MKILKNILLFVGVLIISSVTATYLGRLYFFFFPQISGLGSFIVPPSIYDFVGGIPLSYLFFLPFLFTAFGDKHKYWWIGILLIPALWFEIYFDLSHIYIPIILGILGWGVGFGVSKLLAKKNLS